MLVRAFYPESLAPIVDGVFMHYNYVSTDTLSKALHLQPRELRRRMHQLESVRLIKLEKRAQKKINYADERQPIRTVQTEFWFVPLVEVLDAFLYRVDTLEKEFEKELKAEDEEQSYLCTRCNTKYKLLDIINNMSPDGTFVCDRMDAGGECGGQITEQTVEKEDKESRKLRSAFSEQLKPLRIVATSCAKLSLPAHPLDGIGEKRLSELVPEVITDGTAADSQDGETSDQAKAQGQEGSPIPEPMEGLQFNKDANGTTSQQPESTPARPDWFKEGRRDEDDDWDMAAKIDVTDEAAKRKQEKEEEDDAEFHKLVEKSIQEMSGTTKPAVADGVQQAEQVEASAKKEVLLVDGKEYKQEEITDELISQMTREEYQNYYDQFMTKNGEDDDEDFD